MRVVMRRMVLVFAALVVLAGGLIALTQTSTPTASALGTAVSTAVQTGTPVQCPTVSSGAINEGSGTTEIVGGTQTHDHRGGTTGPGYPNSAFIDMDTWKSGNYGEVVDMFLLIDGEKLDGYNSLTMSFSGAVDLSESKIMMVAQWGSQGSSRFAFDGLMDGISGGSYGNEVWRLGKVYTELDPTQGNKQYRAPLPSPNGSKTEVFNGKELVILDGGTQVTFDNWVHWATWGETTGHVPGSGDSMTLSYSYGDGSAGDRIMDDARINTTRNQASDTLLAWSSPSSDPNLTPQYVTITDDKISTATRMVVYIQAKVRPGTEAGNNFRWGATVHKGSVGTSYRGSDTASAFYRMVYTVSSPSPQIRFQGNYDSPYLDPALFSVPADGILPKGMELTGSVVNHNTGNLATVVEKTASGCVQYSGTIDFSGNTLAEVWKNFGQTAGRTFYLVNDEDKTALSSGKISFRMDIYKDATFTEREDQTYSEDGNEDRMRTGYAKATYQGKTVPVKVRYDLRAREYNAPTNGFNEVRRFNIHVRPFVLSEPDPSLPLNPVASSPYRNLVRWIDFPDQTLSQQLKENGIIRREVIPGFLTVQCRVLDYSSQSLGANQTDWSQADPKSPLDMWAPGTYYEDGAPWIIGDERTLAIHQTGYQNRTMARLECSAFRKDPAQSEEAEPINIPIGAFVALDGESTDGNPAGTDTDDPTKVEFLAMRASHTDNVYPVTGYSSCNADALGRLTATGNLTQAQAGSVRQVIGATKLGTVAFPGASTSFEGLQFYNPQRRCGEANGRDNGTMFGPAIMMVAPVNRSAYIEANNMEAVAPKQVSIAMQGLGKEAIGFGVVLGGDTSNADYDNAMPAVFQLSSLSFHGGKTDTTGTIDWTLANNYEQNFFYYGARLGRRAANYNPSSTTALSVRDGSTNDSLPATSITFGNGAERIQPKVLPISLNTKDLTASYTTDAPGKYFVGADVLVKDTAQSSKNGVVLRRHGRATAPLTITVPCGKAYYTTGTGSQTKIRGWADFNGNGMFDADEASENVASCEPQNGSTKAIKPTGNELPWTDTETVTLTFNYPTEHDINGKRNVWMRLRAVDQVDEAYIQPADPSTPASAQNDEPTAANGFSASVREVNPDADAPKFVSAGARVARAAATTSRPSSAGSVYASWRYSPSGETEDYLFDITPAPKAKDDLFCVAKGETSTVVDVLANDTQDPGDPRTPNPSTLAFLKDQNPGVTVSNNGHRAVVAGEGTYEITNGTIKFTPDQALLDKVNAMTEASSPVALTGVRYAFETATKTATGETIYDRVTAATATLYGNAAFACIPQAQAALTADLSGAMTWDLDKTVLKGDSGSEYEKTDSRTLGSHKKDETVGLTYRLEVTARPADLTASALHGTVLLLNPLAQDVRTAATGGVTLQVSVANSNGLTCKLDDANAANGLLLKSKAPAVPLAFTCTSSSGTLPLEGVTVKPVLTLATSALTRSIPSTDIERGTLTVTNERVRLTDVLTGDGVTGSLDLASVTATVTEAGSTRTEALSSVVLDGPAIVTAGSDGTGTAQIDFVVPQATAPHYTGQAQELTNTASLCDAGTTDSCVPVPKTPAEGDQPGATVPPSTAVVTITPSRPIYILKTGVKDDAAGTVGPLAGSTFEIYTDNGGQLDQRVEGQPKEVNGTAPGGSGAQFVFAQPQAGKTYWLVETKAPAGHQLLAQPVQFTVANDGTVTLGDGKSDYVTVSNDGTEFSLITVRDVEDGHLPAFGGPGIELALGAGLFLLATAYLVRRKRTS